MKKRIYTIDVFRSLALLLVLVYHCWVLTGSLPFKYNVVSLLISLGGEIGVTVFFILSGYGIYCSIAAQKEKDEFQFLPYMKKRCRRIVPQYFFSILFAVVFMYGGSYLSWNGLKSTITHLLFIHNFFVEYHGSINGVLWTMGVTFQFYLVSYLLYKGINRWGIFFEILSVLFTIIAKGILYAYILPYLGLNNSLEFFFGRQLVTALDNFTTGMYISYLVNERDFKCKKGYSYIGIVSGCLLLYIVCYFGMRNGIHTNNISGYTWHSFLTLSLGIILFFCSQTQCNTENKIVKSLLWISKYEYGIYLWHLLIINNLLENSEIVYILLNSSWPKMTYLLFIILSVIIGYIFSQMVDAYMDKIRHGQKI